MPVPTVIGNSAFISQGYTKLWWGTEALFPQSGYIVTSARSAQVAETIPIAQGSGMTVVTQTIIDGSRWEITVEEDLTIEPPAVGQVVKLQQVFISAAIGNSVPPYNNTALNLGNYEVESNDFNAARKEVGTRVFMCRAYQGITNVGGGQNPTVTNTV